MKKVLLALVAVVFTASARAHAESWTEALKGASFEAHWKAAQELPFAIPAEPEAHRVEVQEHNPREIRTFQRGGYTFESNARSARDEAERNLREAGVAVLSSRVYKEDNYPWNHGFSIEYFENNDPYRDERFVFEAYTGGTQTFESKARDEMNRTIENLRSAGYRVILGQVIKQNDYPWNYFYRIDYLRAERRRPPHDRPGVQVYRSGSYHDEIRAQIEMNVMAAAFRSQGKEILSAEVFRVRGEREWRFEIRYREERRHDDNDRGRDRWPGRGPGRDHDRRFFELNY